MTSSLKSSSATLTFDLEDSVHVREKTKARHLLKDFLGGEAIRRAVDQGVDGDGIGRQRSWTGYSIAVRPNSPFTAEEEEADGDRSGRIRDSDATDGLQEPPEGGRADLEAIWGGKEGQSFNSGAGPMMVLPKVQINSKALTFLPKDRLI